jgi:DNA segregation ATPase FtsK/SpoIIIE, S-DNA-T family
MTWRSAVLRSLPPVASWHLVTQELGIKGTKLAAAQSTALGRQFDLELVPPCSVEYLEQKSSLIAVAMDVARVRVFPDPLRATRCALMLDDRLSIGTVKYPSAINPIGIPLDARRPLPLGLDDNGWPICHRFFGQSILIGGSPGSGKSMAMRVFLAGLAASRNVRLVGIDPKRAELAMWSDRFDELILGNSANAAMALLTRLLEEIQCRAASLSSTGQATLPITEQNPWTVLVIDEWAEMGADGDTKERSSLASLLRRFVSLGRAVGFTVILCTQRPTSDAIDVGTRSLIGHRFALRCGDRHQAESILGAGTFTAEQLLGSTPGRALWSDGGIAEALQFFEIPDEMIPELTCPVFRNLYEPNQNVAIGNG